MVKVGVTFRLEDKLTRYAEAVRHVGLEPVPLQAPGPHTLNGLRGLLISGGTDLDPDLYGEDPHPEAESPDRERDEMELWLLHDALAADLPVFCICRGLQLLNVAFGGTLVQHLPQVELHRRPGVLDAHEIRVMPGSALAAITGAEPYTVNSRHHQAVARPAHGLLVSAKAHDGVVEGLEVPGKRFALAVQWHPEARVPSHSPDTRLFEAFAAAAGSQ